MTRYQCKHMRADGYCPLAEKNHGELAWELSKRNPAYGVTCPVVETWDCSDFEEGCVGYWNGCNCLYCQEQDRPEINDLNI